MLPQRIEYLIFRISYSHGLDLLFVEYMSCFSDIFVKDLCSNLGLSNELLSLFPCFPKIDLQEIN